MVPVLGASGAVSVVVVEFPQQQHTSKQQLFDGIQTFLFSQQQQTAPRKIAFVYV
mgnify:CR=1 FL=1